MGTMARPPSIIYHTYDVFEPKSFKKYNMASIAYLTVRCQKNNMALYIDVKSWQAECPKHHTLMLPGEINISQLQGKIEFNTFLFCKPYNWCIQWLKMILF